MRSALQRVEVVETYERTANPRPAPSSADRASPRWRIVRETAAFLAVAGFGAAVILFAMVVA